MKILFMTSSFLGGGITSFGHEVANAYSTDNEFSIIIGSDAKFPIQNEKVKKYYYDCHDLGLANVKALIHLIDHIIQPDLIIGSNARVLPVIAKYLNDSIKIITVSHSLKFIEADVAAVSHRFVDYIIAGSVYNEQYMANKFTIKSNNKIKVIYNFVKDYQHSEDIIAAKKTAEVPSIVFPGGCAAPKSPEIVLQIVRKLVDTDASFKFYWMGRTTIHLSRHFPFFHVKDIRDIAPKDPRVVFTGRLATRQEAENLIASGNIQLSPSRREGCPMSFLEAIRVGTIAIVADFGNFNREIVEKGGFGYVIHYNDIDSFANQIVDICRNHTSYSDLYDRSRNAFERELSFDVWKRKMDNLIYSEGFNHVERKKSVSNIGLLSNIMKIKILFLQSIIEGGFLENFKVLFRMWKLKNKPFIRDNR